MDRVEVGAVVDRVEVEALVPHRPRSRGVQGLARGGRLQKRRLLADRRELLIQAVVDVVLTEGVAGMTVDRVCVSAQLTKLYFYKSFPDLDALLVAAVDELLVVGGRSTLRPPVCECPGHPVLRARQGEAISVFSVLVLERMLPEPRVAYLMEHHRLAARLLAGRPPVAPSARRVIASMGPDSDHLP